MFLIGRCRNVIILHSYLGLKTLFCPEDCSLLDFEYARLIILSQRYPIKNYLEKIFSNYLGKNNTPFLYAYIYLQGNLNNIII
jgi:hypothetical protein